ncbi:hypothetical protein GYMLUDRAFT_85616, partial [Collybiopsis luxurians FD-317 M1]
MTGKTAHNFKRYGKRARSSSPVPSDPGSDYVDLDALPKPKATGRPLIVAKKATAMRGKAGKRNTATVRAKASEKTKVPPKPKNNAEDNKPTRRSARVAGKQIEIRDGQGSGNSIPKDGSEEVKGRGNHECADTKATKENHNKEISKPHPKPRPIMDNGGLDEPTEISHKPATGISKASRTHSKEVEVRCTVPSCSLF